MTNQRPITPPPELVQQWRKSGPADAAVNNAYERHIAHQAARWGADQQLAEDAKWLDQHALDAPHLKITPVGESLIEAMRPEPPSLAKRALHELNDVYNRDKIVAVSERLPGPEDCILPTGECWWFDPHADGAWYVDTFQSNYTHWLPANALPTPEYTND